MSESSSSRLKRAVVLGALNNLVFAFGGGVLSFLQFIVVIRIVGPSEIGLYAVAAAVALTIEALSDFGIGEQIVQTDDERLERMFPVAVAAHAALACALFALVVASAIPVARFYDEPRLGHLILAMSYGAFTGLLRLPLFLLYRDLKYFQQRLLNFIGKLAGFVVTVSSAYTGLGIWSLVVGGLTAVLVTGIPAWWLSPLKPSWPRHWSGLRDVFAFSWPLYITRVSMNVVQHGAILVLSTFLLTADVGQFKAAEQIAFFLVSIDVILGQTVFPALCKVKQSPSHLAEAFEASSRVAMLWTAGGGMAMAVFPAALIELGLTDAWAGGELFLRAHGMALILGGIAYSWPGLFMAKGSTRPVLGFTIVYALAFAGLFVPLTFGFGRLGAAAGLVLTAAVGLLAKQVLLNRAEMSVSLFAIARRPVLAAGAAALAASAISLSLSLSLGLSEVSDNTRAALELAVYGVIYGVVWLWLESHLLKRLLEEFSFGRRLTGLLFGRVSRGAA